MINIKMKIKIGIKVKIKKSLLMKIHTVQFIVKHSQVGCTENFETKREEGTGFLVQSILQTIHKIINGTIGLDQ